MPTAFTALLPADSWVLPWLIPNIADKVIVVTDNLVDFPCIPWQIQGNYVDFTVVMDRLGDPSKIVRDHTDHKIARPAFSG